MAACRLDPSDFPHSPYAAELRRGAAKPRFSEPLEAEYSRAFLRCSRTLIQVVSAAALVLVLLHCLERSLLGFAPTIIPGCYGCMVYLFGTACSAALAWLAWSPSFERNYLPAARVLLPLRNAIVAVQVARMAAHGALDLFIIMPAMVIGPFFCLGLHARAALATALAASVSFMLAALYFHVPPVAQLRGDTFLLLILGTCTLAAQRLDGWARTWFLEDHLICELAEHDALTGTKNRRVFDDHLLRLWQQAVTDGRTLAVLLLDVDHFKKYNDRYGHQAGDEVLRQVAQTVQGQVQRPLDMLARYGGEEFAVILYDIDHQRAQHIAEQMRSTVAGLRVQRAGNASGAAVTVTVSVGVALIQPTAARHCSGILQLADEALYEAKRTGRNRIVLVDDKEHRLLVTGMFAALSPDGLAAGLGE